jgi:hypothetical protein
MELNKLQTLLDHLGIKYQFTANRPISQYSQSQGHYNLTGDWIEDSQILDLEPDGIEIQKMPKVTQQCEYCDIVVDQAPVLHIKKSNEKNNNLWVARCRTCKKDVRFQDFKHKNPPHTK